MEAACRGRRHWRGAEEAIDGGRTPLLRSATVGLADGQTTGNNEGHPMRRHLVAVLAAVVLLPSMVGAQTAPPNPVTTAPSQFNELTVVQLQALMASGQLSSVALTNFYINRILQLDQNGPG